MGRDSVEHTKREVCSYPGVGWPNTTRTRLTDPANRQPPEHSRKSEKLFCKDTENCSREHQLITRVIPQPHGDISYIPTWIINCSYTLCGTGNGSFGSLSLDFHTYVELWDKSMTGPRNFGFVWTTLFSLSSAHQWQHSWRGWSTTELLLLSAEPNPSKGVSALSMDRTLSDTPQELRLQGQIQEETVPNIQALDLRSRVLAPVLWGNWEEKGPGVTPDEQKLCAGFQGSGGDRLGLTQ
ncbi:hypothetical protein WISP_29652 [Willisornis vidua]|uniref:Uncharacterized protein n=1 Tax=Willisornis vidua TaxID=1566151 RepID=A0ABQ9DKJ6_9PASS|nr:hypothetical protein WISP_29652 [Willisornis vidua]